MEIKLAHSPDADDAFMFYALAEGLIDTGEYQFQHVLEDIQTLNEKARQGIYDITALSVAAYPLVAERYQLLPCGASMGDGYGPIVVSRDPRPVSSLHECLLAVPGLQTSAYMALCIYLYPHKPTVKVVRFDEIPERVLSGEVDAGLLIHEGQITYQDAGMYLIEDLGIWWTRETSLPLPLGVNVIRRELTGVDKSKLARILRESVTYSLTHREKALEYALSFSHGLEAEKAIRFIEMYVNDLTLDLGERGRLAIELFLSRGSTELQNQTSPVLDFVEY